MPIFCPLSLAKILHGEREIKFSLKSYNFKVSRPKSSFFQNSLAYTGLRDYTTYQETFINIKKRFDSHIEKSLITGVIITSV